MPQKKLVIGWFSFTCCEDSTMMFVELLNTHYKEWLPVLEIEHARVLKRNNKLKGIDVAFVEGAVATHFDEKEVKEIRKHAKYVVAIGSCAVMGQPAGQRNFFDKQTITEVANILARFSHLKKVKAINEVIKVDDVVPGCPMNNEQFIQILNKYLNKFGVTNA